MRSGSIIVLKPSFLSLAFLEASSMADSLIPSQGNVWRLRLVSVAFFGSVLLIAKYLGSHEIPQAEIHAHKKRFPLYLSRSVGDEFLSPN